MIRNSLTQLIGWYGVLAILAAYVLSSFSFISAHGLSYQLLNLTGASAIVIETAKKKDAQPLALNAVWALVALIGLIQLIRK